MYNLAGMVRDAETSDLDEEEYYANSSIDGLPARVVGDWSNDKHYYLRRYIDIFENGTHRKWAQRAFIDLFSGPGVCLLRKQRQVIDGSPLIALKVNPPFSQYFFSDLDATAVSALKKRCEPFNDSAEINIFQDDCNKVVANIAAKIKPGSLCVAFLDPTNLTLKFNSIKTLTEGKAMDLIIHFSHANAIKRNIDEFYARKSPIMDDFFGGSDWRSVYEKKPKNLTDELLRLYKTKLATIGYTMEPDQAIVIKNSKNVPLYALLFASKHPLGMKFWKEIKKIDSKGERELPGI